MTSSVWEVEARGTRYVLKISELGTEPGLRAAACLEGRGIRAGAPLRTARRDGRLVALLRFIDGRAPSIDDVETIGTVLGVAHGLLESCPVPRRMQRWPWAWPDPAVVAEPALRSAVAAARDRALELAPALTHGILHGDPEPGAFRDADGKVGLIDWGAACHGPLLYDFASAWLYTDARVIDGYKRTSSLIREELTHLADFLAFRWAVQAWYFSDRLARRDLTGILDAAENEKGLGDARAALLVSGDRVCRWEGRPRCRFVGFAGGGRMCPRSGSEPMSQVLDPSLADKARSALRRHAIDPRERAYGHR